LGLKKLKMTLLTILTNKITIISGIILIPILVAYLILINSLTIINPNTQQITLLCSDNTNETYNNISDLNNATYICKTKNIDKVLDTFININFYNIINGKQFK
jgi:hypothetical protein